MSNLENLRISEALLESPAPTFHIACRAFQVKYKIREVIDQLAERYSERAEEMEENQDL